MSEAAYYRFSLMIPFLPGLLWTLVGSEDPGASTIRRSVLWFGLGPYAVFSLVLTIWSLEQSARRIRIALLLAPLLFSLIVSAVAYPVAALVFGAGVGTTVLTLAPYCLFVGYACVALAFGLLIVLEVAHLVSRESVLSRLVDRPRRPSGLPNTRLELAGAAE